MTRVGRPRRLDKKETSKWFKGDFYGMSSTDMERVRRKYEKDVRKPTAVESKIVNGVTYSRFYYKPLKPSELS